MQASDTHRIDVIIPVYNAEKTLSRCLDSLISQDYPEWRAILVDDCSRDGSREIMEQYAERDARFLCIYAPANAGAAAARNMALTRLDSEYTAFLDSDDWLSEDALSRLMGTALRTGADIVQCEWILEYPDNTQGTDPLLFETETVVDRKHYDLILKRMMTGIDLNHVCRKLTRTRLFEGLQFDRSLKTAEDLLMCFRLLMKSRVFVFIPDRAYHYFRHAESLTGKGLSVRKKWECNRKVSLKMIREMRNTEFGTFRYFCMAWIRPYMLVVPKLKRVLADRNGQK